jgi:hypothetical protein
MVDAVYDAAGFGQGSWSVQTAAAKQLSIDFPRRVKQALGMWQPTNKWLITHKDKGTGLTRVTMTYSNMFRDRHKEILISEAHKEYEAWVDATKQYPVFRLWHLKGTEWGQVDGIAYDDSGFIIATGLCYPGCEFIAERLAELDTGASHGFVYAQRGNDVIKYRTYEVSPLPYKAAANIWHSGVAVMAMTKEKRDWLIGELGLKPEFVDQLEASNKAQAELLEGNVDHKDAEGSTGGAGAEGTGEAGVEGAAGAGDGTPAIAAEGAEGLADLFAAALKPFGDRLAAIEASIGEVKEKQVSMSEQLTAAEKSMDDRVADKFRAAVDKLPQGFDATKENSVDAKNGGSQALETEWFAGLVGEVK